MEDEKLPSASPRTEAPERKLNWAERLIEPLLWAVKPPLRVDKHDPENNSGSGGPVPPEIAARHWCWGALGLGPIWSAYNGLAWLVLIQLIPLLSIPITLHLFYAGYAEAWRNRHFRNREEFARTMRVWNIAGLIAFPCWVAIQVSLYMNR